MPNFETPGELAELLADWLGIYGSLPQYDNGPQHDLDCQCEHEEHCRCRMCFVLPMTARIRQSVKNEKALNSQAPPAVNDLPHLPN